MKDTKIFYMIGQEVIWRKEKGNLMILLPKNKRFLTFNNEISSLVDDLGYIKYVDKYKLTFDLLKNNNATIPVKIPHEWNSVSRDRSGTGFPLNVTFQITNSCNLDCAHCHRVKEKYNNISIDDFKRTIDELRVGKVFNINISGGEPLIHPNIMDMLSYVAKSGMNVTMSTNGLLWNNELAKKASTLGLKHVHISLDSSDSKLHDKIRGMGGAYRLLLEKLKILQNNNIEYTLVTTIIDQTPKEYEETIDLAFELKAVAHKTNTCIIQGDGKENKVEFIDHSKHREIRKKQKNKYLGKMNILAETMFLIELGEQYISPLGIPEALNCGCPAGILTSAINEKGEVLACPFFGDLPMGSIIESSFTKIWNNSNLLKKLRDRKSLSVCSDCELVNKCGGCRARSFGLFNKLNKEDPLCFINNEKNI